MDDRNHIIFLPATRAERREAAKRAGLPVDKMVAPYLEDGAGTPLPQWWPMPKGPIPDGLSENDKVAMRNRMRENTTVRLRDSKGDGKFWITVLINCVYVPYFYFAVGESG